MVTRPGNRVARISPLIPGVDLVGTVLGLGRPLGDRRPARSSPTATTSGVAHHGGFSQLARVPAGWVVPLPDGPRRPAGGHHRHRRVHRRPLPPPARAPRPRARRRPGAGHRGLRAAWAAWPWPCWRRAGYEVVASTGQGRPNRSTSPGSGPPEVIGRDELVERTGADPGRRAVGRCRGLRRRVHAGRRAADPALRGRRGGQRADRRAPPWRPRSIPFIVRNASLIGVDTVSTPIAERRAGVGARWPPPSRPARWRTWSSGSSASTSCGPALERILAGGARGRMLVRPGRRRDRGSAAGRCGGLARPGPVAENTGDTTSVPPPHGARVAVSTRWSKALGGVTSSDAEVGQLVSLPTGTSE